VLSRYDGVGGYDWIAIPLVPYLYAVGRPEVVPLFADAKIVTSCGIVTAGNIWKNRSRLAKRRDPGGNWYELVGSSYDRTTYGFDIETSPEYLTAGTTA